MTTFDGFADADAKFFKQLAKNNDKAGFQAHKAEYEEGWNTPMKLLLVDVRKGVDRAFSHCDLDEPKVFRIFRDVRFSKDKTPYKTHIGGYIPLARTGKRATDLPMALYFQVGDETFGGAGHYMMEPDSLARFRKAIAEDKRVLTSLQKRGEMNAPVERRSRATDAFSVVTSSACSSRSPC